MPVRSFFGLAKVNRLLLKIRLRGSTPDIFIYASSQMEEAYASDVLDPIQAYTHITYPPTIYSQHACERYRQGKRSANALYKFAGVMLE